MIYTWVKYGHHILPSTISLNAMENLQTNSTYCNALRQVLHADLDGNLSTSLNPPTKDKLNKYVSTFFGGKSKTTTLDNTFDKYMEKPESRKSITKKVREVALSATMIPLSLFANLFVKKFPKHEYLESTHELMQQVYIKMRTESGCFCLFTRDLSIYSLKCIRCRRSITAPGSIGETLYHAPIAMLPHRDMICTAVSPGEFDNASIPLVCTKLDFYHQALASFNKTLPGSYETRLN
jgi:hypothetical protein